MLLALRAFPFGRALQAQATVWRFLLVATSHPHFIDVSKRSKFLAGDLLDDQSSAVALSSETANCHSAEWKCELNCLLKPQRHVYPSVAMFVNAGVSCCRRGAPPRLTSAGQLLPLLSISLHSADPKVRCGSRIGSAPSGVEHQGSADGSSRSALRHQLPYRPVDNLWINCHHLDRLPPTFKGQSANI